MKTFNISLQVQDNMSIYSEEDIKTIIRDALTTEKGYGFNIDNLSVQKDDWAIPYDVMTCILDALKIFPGMFINHNNELIFDLKQNLYFLLEDVRTPLDFNCKFIA